MKALSVCLLLIGITWTGLMGWLYLISGVIVFVGLLLGPMTLIVGPILILAGWHTRLGAIVTLVGSAIVTIYMGYGLIGILHVEPLQVRPPYVLYASMTIITLLADAGAIWLCRLLLSGEEEKEGV
jgi:hypothetical protein